MVDQRNVEDSSDLSDAPPTEAQADQGDKALWRVKWFQKWRHPITTWWHDVASTPENGMDDLAEEVYKRLEHYSEEAAVENAQGYLFEIASTVVNEWREQNRVSKQPESQDALPTTAMLQAVVDKLPERQRDALLLHVNKGKTYRQIAKKRGLSPRIVLRDLVRAYSSLRMQLLPKRH